MTQNSDHLYTVHRTALAALHVRPLVQVVFPSEF